MHLHFLLSATVVWTACSARMAYQFSSGWEDVLGEVVEGFSCEGRGYGYYADVDNDCRVFHVCVPIANAEGDVVNVDQYSFFCGNQTVFNQESLTCTHDIDAFPCREAASLYDLVNSEFGLVKERVPEESATESTLIAIEFQGEGRAVAEDDQLQEVTDDETVPVVPDLEPLETAS